MPDPITDLPLIGGGQTRKEKRKTLKKLKRKRIRKEAAIREREEEEARLNDPQEQLRIKLKEEEEAAIAERGRIEFEEREKLWIEAVERKREEEERRRQKLLEESEIWKAEHKKELEDDDEWDYAEEGPAEIIWKGNEIILKKKRVKVAKKTADRKPDYEDVDRPTSNPLPPQSVAFSSYNSEKSLTAQELLEGVAQQVPNFGTEQDKAHCPFHLKTGACRFGTRCSRVHFYPDKSCTLLIKSMYNGPGLAWDQDEGLEYTDEEVERCYEEFYEDVHTEFLKFGELVNFKVCKNGSYHLRGNVYVHYKSLESAILAYNTMNGRYFAGKQITCQFVGVIRWKVAICGEFMKSRLRTCSHGSACNFIHCFRNPGGDYEWADWDNPPPQYWIRKMAGLFGHSDELSNGNQMKVRDRQRDRRGSHSRIDDSERRRETSFRENHESKVYDYDTKDHRRKHKRSRRREEEKSETRSRNIKHESTDEFSDRWEETHDHSCVHWKATRSCKRRRKHEVNSSCSDEESDRREREDSGSRWMTGSGRKQRSILSSGCGM